MDYKEILGVAIILIGFIGQIPYFINVVKKKTRPNPLSWLTWSISTAVLLAVISFSGGGAAVWSMWSYLIFQILICIFAFKNGGKRDITRTDLASFGAAIAALTMWLIWRDLAALAAALITITEVFGWFPTIRKAWIKPHEETLILWAVDFFQCILLLLALGQYNFATVVNYATWLVCYGITVAVLVGRRKVLK